MKTRIAGSLALFLVLAGGSASWARGGGGCLEHGTLILTPDGPIPIERLQPASTVWTVVDGKLRQGIVYARIEVQPDEYLVLTASGRRLRLTAEHPVMIAPGVFQRAASLRAGDRLWLWHQDKLTETTLESVSRAPADRAAFNLLVSPGGTYLANDFVVHNKGCFLPDTPILKADGTVAPIRGIQPGDQLLAFTPEGKIVHAGVRSVLTSEVDEYAVVATERIVLRVTLDHPFYVGAGTFRCPSALRVGDGVMAYDGSGLSFQWITHIQYVRHRTRVYNLQTDAPHTFFANGIAVHNKGGGGCFPAGTSIRTPRGPVSIEQLTVGDVVQAVMADGVIVQTQVTGLIAARASLLEIQTDRGRLRTTADHPVALAEGGFRPAGQMAPGERILAFLDGRRQQPATVLSCRVTSLEEPVFNLQVGWPHTFVADDFVVHNKGGGGGFSGGGGGWHSSSGGHGSGDLPHGFLLSVLIGGLVGGTSRAIVRRQQGAAGQFLVGAALGAVAGPITLLALACDVGLGLFAAIFMAAFIAAGAKFQSRKDEDLDYLYSPREIDKKAKKSHKLLEFLARQDASVEPETLRRQAEATFQQLQDCWQARDYTPMKPLLMPDLFAQHVAQLNGMKRDHEINRIENLQVQRIDVVNIRYTDKPDQREFTALITAQARDYYVDDCSGAFLRGDARPARFQEFWTFHRQGNTWLLRDVEQSRESDVLKEENFVEQFTDPQVQAAYQEAAGTQGPAGPWLEKQVETKTGRIDRLLNFLVQTDRLWDQEKMRLRARQVFADVFLAQEAGNPDAVKTEELFPDVATSLQDQIRERSAHGMRVEYRNLCIRKLELVLVRNYADNARDEFTARIRAHAQKIVRRGEAVVTEDEYVSPFEEYWTFGRLNEQWKLKEVLPSASGERAIAQENVDEDSSAGQLQWYYRQTRAN